jgi:hypothetical protein
MSKNRGWSREVGVWKLKAAAFFLDKFRETETFEACVYFLSAFVCAGRSVAVTLDQRMKPEYAKWRKGRTEVEQRLLRFMKDERDEDVHMAGASRGVTVPVPTLGGSAMPSDPSFITFSFNGKT